MIWSLWSSIHHSYQKSPKLSLLIIQIDELVLDIIGRDSEKLNGTDFIVNHQPLFTGETTNTFDETLNMVAKVNFNLKMLKDLIIKYTLGVENFNNNEKPSIQRVSLSIQYT